MTNIKGTMQTISPGHNRVNFQILAYLLTIDGLLTYSMALDAYHIDSVNTCRVSCRISPFGGELKDFGGGVA